jgi:hypothetical protein
MRIVASLAAALAFISPALAIDAEREPNLPASIHARQLPPAQLHGARGKRPVRVAPQPATATPTLFGLYPFGSFAERAIERRGPGRAHASLGLLPRRGHCSPRRSERGADGARPPRRHARERRQPARREQGQLRPDADPPRHSAGHGYQGDARGLLDPEINMTYAMRYLAGAHRAAKGNHDRAIQLYACGYYYEAKAQGFSPYVSN